MCGIFFPAAQLFVIAIGDILRIGGGNLYLTSVRFESRGMTDVRAAVDCSFTSRRKHEDRETRLQLPTNVTTITKMTHRSPTPESETGGYPVIDHEYPGIQVRASS